MIDTDFYKKTGSYKLKYLADISGGELSDPANADLMIRNVSSLDNAGEGDITFLQNSKYTENFKVTKASACVVLPKNVKLAPKKLALIISDNPYYSFAMISEKFYHQENLFTELSEQAYIDYTATIGNRTHIGAFSYIGQNVKIGRNCIINSNVTITNAIIGDNVIIHSGTRIGQDGFGYAFHNGRHHKVMQLGRVIIENDVEIGANTTIDRGSGPDTVIGEGTKIDNLVQIGHNVKIGKNCIIVAQVGISGSTEIGDYTVLGGQAGTVGHIKIGSKVQIAAKAGVMEDIKDGAIVGGYPAVPIKQFHRQTIYLKNITNAGRKRDE